MLNLTGLSEKTRQVFELLAADPVLQPYVLIGGTALAMHLNHRLSEDLDFCVWSIEPGKKIVGIPADSLLRTLSADNRQVEVLSLLPNQLALVLNGVKLTFFADNENLPITDIVAYNPNIRVAGLAALTGMKIGVMFNRETYRDYYDVYAIAQSDRPIRQMVSEAIAFKPYLNDRLIALKLTYPELQKEENIQHLLPRYAVNVTMIANYFKESFQKMNR